MGDCNFTFVALLAEGVDRNKLTTSSDQHAFVALLAEGVDRNNTSRGRISRRYESPSSRRAWIEIYSYNYTLPVNKVALLAEGVDRNYHCEETLYRTKASPSSRRAWIEIFR